MASLKEKVVKVIRGNADSDDLRARGAIIGNNVNLYTSKIDKAHAYLLEIGNDVTISDARILLHDASMKLPLGYTKMAKVKIGNNVYIGADAIVLPGVTIGDDVIIGAGAVIARDVESNSVMVGNPAKKVGTYTDFVEKNRKLLEKYPRIEKEALEMSDSEKQEIREKMKDGIGFER
ncbi:MAG: acyltransferase [Erysipelotrichaceae bacterium]|nr:acyltransferase [Erysipelotrichaceae bacterium]